MTDDSAHSVSILSSLEGQSSKALDLAFPDLMSCCVKIRFYIVNWANDSIFNKNIKHFSVYFTLKRDYLLSRSPQEKVLLGKTPLLILGWAPHYLTKPYSLNFQLHKDSSYNAKAEATQGPEQRAGQTLAHQVSSDHQIGLISSLKRLHQVPDQSQY